MKRMAILLLVSTIISEPVQAYPVWGPANSTCEQWTRDKTEPVLRVGQNAYIAGFLTAVNMESRSDQTGTTNVQDVVEEIDELCVRTPNEKVALILQLIATNLHAQAVLDGRSPDYEFDFK